MNICTVSASVTGKMARRKLMYTLRGSRDRRRTVPARLSSRISSIGSSKSGYSGPRKYCPSGMTRVKTPVNGELISRTRKTAHRPSTARMSRLSRKSSAQLCSRYTVSMGSGSERSIHSTSSRAYIAAPETR